ncbi:hypothetical protein AAIH70_30040 [Neorhizobium sp. BT27B]|uniref:hypothetical protein n=1 Tax=Neorhizobium sp. BT27B TaxID=3142625 RepID=UPI003D2E14F4
MSIDVAHGLFQSLMSMKDLIGAGAKFQHQNEILHQVARMSGTFPSRWVIAEVDDWPAPISHFMLASPTHSPMALKSQTSEYDNHLFGPTVSYRKLPPAVQMSLG